MYLWPITRQAVEEEVGRLFTPVNFVKRFVVLVFGGFNLCTHYIQLLLPSYQMGIYLLQDHLYHSFPIQHRMIFTISYVQKLMGILGKMLGNALLCFSSLYIVLNQDSRYLTVGIPQGTLQPPSPPRNLFLEVSDVNLIDDWLRNTEYMVTPSITCLVKTCLGSGEKCNDRKLQSKITP